MSDIFLQDQKSYIEYEVDSHTNCEHHGCDDEGICRCYTIDSVHIKHIDLSLISESAIRRYNYNNSSKSAERERKLSSLLYGYDGLDEYCLNRILVANKVYDVNRWEASWSYNYYGDEIDDILLEMTTYKKVVEDIEYVFNLKTIKEKIEFLIILEYGTLLDKIKNKNYEIIDVLKSDIILGQKIYADKISSDVYEHYTDDKFKLIRGICIFENGKYRLIDGYHRVTSTKMKTVKIISIYE